MFIMFKRGRRAPRYIFRACSAPVCTHLACIFSAILPENFSAYVSMSAKFSNNLTKNLTAQSAHSQILNRLLHSRYKHRYNTDCDRHQHSHGNNGTYDFFLLIIETHNITPFYILFNFVIHTHYDSRRLSACSLVIFRVVNRSVGILTSVYKSP